MLLTVRDPEDDFVGRKACHTATLLLASVHGNGCRSVRKKRVYTVALAVCVGKCSIRETYAVVRDHFRWSWKTNAGARTTHRTFIVALVLLHCTERIMYFYTSYRMNVSSEQVFSATHTTEAKSLATSCSVVRMRSERSLFALALPDSKLLKFGRSISAL